MASISVIGYTVTCQLVQELLLKSKIHLAQLLKLQLPINYTYTIVIPTESTTLSQQLLALTKDVDVTIQYINRSNN